MGKVEELVKKVFGDKWELALMLVEYGRGKLSEEEIVKLLEKHTERRLPFCKRCGHLIIFEVEDGKGECVECGKKEDVQWVKF